MRVFCASRSDIERDWARFWIHLARFEVEVGEYTPEQVRQAILAERQQLWGLQDRMGVKLVCVTEVLQSARGKICLITVGCGKASRSALRELMRRIQGWARSIGCIAVRILGRRGWLRIFPDFEPVGLIMECAL